LVPTSILADEMDAKAMVTQDLVTMAIFWCANGISYELVGICQ
jgi:hypothetical protein